MGVSEGMRFLDQADDLVHKAGKEFLPLMENGPLPPHFYMEVISLREALRDLEARIGEHVMAIIEESPHA